jgi:cytochrome c-type biogenesis protein CcmH
MGNRTRGLVSRRAMLLVGVAALTGAAVPAQEPAAQKTARELAHELMSPFCPGRTLADCPSPQAAQLRDHIRARLDSGATRAEVVDELYATYGDTILGAPRARGLGLLAWIVPGVFLLAGVWFIVRWARHSRRGPPDGVPPSPELAPDDIRRLESELAEL